MSRYIILLSSFCLFVVIVFTAVIKDFIGFGFFVSLNASGLIVLLLTLKIWDRKKEHEK